MYHNKGPISLREVLKHDNNDVIKGTMGVQD